MGTHSCPFVAISKSGLGSWGSSISNCPSRIRYPPVPRSYYSTNDELGMARSRTLFGRDGRPRPRAPLFFLFHLVRVQRGAHGWLWRAPFPSPPRPLVTPGCGMGGSRASGRAKEGWIPTRGWLPGPSVEVHRTRCGIWDSFQVEGNVRERALNAAATSARFLSSAQRSGTGLRGSAINVNVTCEAASGCGKASAPCKTPSRDGTLPIESGGVCRRLYKRGAVMTS